MNEGRTMRKMLAGVAMMLAFAAITPAAFEWTPVAAQGGVKGVSCQGIGCDGGPRDCAHITIRGQAGAGIIAIEVEGEVEVTFFCYEPEAD